MWPINPDDFISETNEPDGADADNSLYFVFIDGQILSLSEQGIPRPPTRDDYRWLDLETRYKHYMGRYNGASAYAMEAAGQPPEGFACTDLRAWLGRATPSLFYLAGRAKQMVEWHRDHAHCGRCGSEMVEHEVDRAMHCPECDLISYPRLSPSIIVLIRNGDKMLLARNAQWPTGMFSTLAGFVEAGESIEQTVHREIEEEVGLRVGNLRYMGSQSWPFPNSLMLGFHVDYEGGDIVCQDGEIAEADWFHFDELPNVPPRTAISRWLIDAFIEEQGGTVR